MIPVITKMDSSPNRNEKVSGNRSIETEVIPTIENLEGPLFSNEKFSNLLSKPTETIPI